MKSMWFLVILCSLAFGTWHNQVVNTSGCGKYVSLTMDESGIVMISNGEYWLWMNYSIYSGWYNYELSTEPSYLYTSCALSTQTLSHISCNHNGELVYYGPGPFGYVLDSSCDGGTSIALTSSGSPAIAYYGDTDLKYLSWDGSQWNGGVVVNDGDHSQVSLAFNSQDHPRIAGASTNELIYASWTGSEWSITQVESGDDFLCEGISLKLDSSDNPHIACRRNDDLYYYSFSGTEWTAELLDQGFCTPLSSVSLTLDSYDDPHIAYNAVSDTLSIIVYMHDDGSGWSREELAQGSYPSIIIDSFGDPAIAYGLGIDGIKYLCHNPVGIFGEPAESKFLCSVYPNPCRTVLSLDVNLPEQGTPSVAVCDLSGRVVHRQEFTDVHQGESTLQVQLGDLPSGVYLCSITCSGISEGSFFTFLR